MEKNIKAIKASASGWSTGMTLLTSALLSHFFKVAFSAQFFKAELSGSTEQQLFTVHALLLHFSWFCLLLQPLQRRFLSTGFTEWQNFVHCWVDLTRSPNRKQERKQDGKLNRKQGVLTIIASIIICRLCWPLTLLEAHPSPPQMVERLVWKVVGPEQYVQILISVVSVAQRHNGGVADFTDVTL